MKIGKTLWTYCNSITVSGIASSTETVKCKKQIKLFIVILCVQEVLPYSQQSCGSGLILTSTGSTNEKNLHDPLTLIIFGWNHRLIYGWNTPYLYGGRGGWGIWAIFLFYPIHIILNWNFRHLSWLGQYQTVIFFL